jgi:hypothetical protein
MDSKLGVIAGSGEFPYYICMRIQSSGHRCVVAAIAGEADESLQKQADAMQTFSLDDLNGITGFLHDQKVEKVLLAGKIEHRRIFNKGDPRSLMIKIMSKGKDKNAATLISLAIEYLYKQGFDVLDPRPFLSETFCEAGILSGNKIKKPVAADIEFGWPLVRKIADMDIGQTLVVKDQAVVAVEGMEGTNAAIQRAGGLAGPGAVVLKSGRSSQDPRIDLPAVGMDTIKTCLEAGCEALCFEAGTMPFFQKEDSLKLAAGRDLAVIAKNADT